MINQELFFKLYSRIVTLLPNIKITYEIIMGGNVVMIVYMVNNISLTSYVNNVELKNIQSDLPKYVTNVKKALVYKLFGDIR